MKASKRFWKTISLILFIFVFFTYIIPLLWMVISSFKPEAHIFNNMEGLNFLKVEKFTLNNYIKALTRIPMLRYILNSLVYTLIIVFCGLIVNSLCGYALAKLPVPGKKWILLIIIGLLIVPFESIILPLYLIVSKFGWINRLPALFMPFIANCFNIFMFRQFFMSIPKEMEEASYIDGASPLRTFFQIILPISKPVFATVAILTFVGHWGDFMWPLITATKANQRTIQVGIQFFFTQTPKYGEILAALTFTTIPMIIVFTLFQKYYIQGITSSGIKG